MSINGLPTPNWQAFIRARELCASEMVVEIFREGAHITFEVPLEPQSQLDAQQVLAEIMAEHIAPLVSHHADSWRRKLAPDSTN